jgi:hypothetical protein
MTPLLKPCVQPTSRSRRGVIERFPVFQIGNR